MKRQKIIYSDGGCKGNNRKEISERRMVICIVDDQIRNHSQVRGATKPGGSNNIAELLAVWEAICYAFKREYKNLLLRVDSQVVFHWIENETIKGKVNDIEFTTMILNKIVKMKTWFDKFEIQVVPRGINKAGIILEKKTKGKDFI